MAKGHRVSVGLDVTFRFLTTTANETASDVLIHALDVPDREVRERALRTILSRRNQAAHREVLRRWKHFDERTRQLLGERPGRISAAIREAILSKDREVYFSGCDAVVRNREFDLIPALSHAAEDRENAHAEVAAKALLALATMLDDEIASPGDSDTRFDPHRIRQYVQAGLEQSVLRFEEHKRPEIVEAFLLLSTADNLTVRRMLEDELNKCHATAVECLARSPRRGVMRLLTEFFEDPQAPAAVLEQIARRKDSEFVRHLLRAVGPQPSTVILGHLRRMTPFRWIVDEPQPLAEFGEGEQRAALAMILGSTAKRDQQFALVQLFLLQGQRGAQRDAARALADFRGVEANDLLLEALYCEAPEIQAILAAQLRDRGIAGAMSRLIELLDSPHQEVREAARQGLVEYNFQRYLSAFDLLDEEVRRNTGWLVKKVDLQALNALQQELRAPVRARRLRALGAAIAMDAVTDIEETVYELLLEPDQHVRALAARALGRCDSTKSRRVLRQALLDQHASVRDEAEQALHLQMERQARLAAESAPATVTVPQESLA